MDAGAGGGRWLDSELAADDVLGDLSDATEVSPEVNVRWIERRWVDMASVGSEQGSG